MQETQVRSLGGEDPLEKEMAPHSSTLAWKIPWTEEPGRLQSMGSLRVGQDWSNLAAAAAPGFIVCRLFDSSHSDWHEMVPHCGFDLRFSDNEWCWASFHVFISHLYVFFEKCLFSSLAHFFLIGSLIFLELSCRSCFYNFEINSLSVASLLLSSPILKAVFSPC